MGLASKLAAANANAGAGAPGGQSSYPGQQQQSYQQAPGAPQQQPGSTSSYSSYPGQQQTHSQSQTNHPGQGYAPPSGPPPAAGARPTSYGQAPPGYAPPPGAPPPGQGHTQYSGQTNPQPYGQTSQTQQYGQQQQQSYGQPQQNYGQQPHQQQAYGAPPGAPPRPGQPGQPPAQHPPAGGASSDPRYILGVLQQCVQEQRIQAFYPPGSLEPLANRVAQSGVLDRIATEWRMPKEIASDLVKLSLFDTILYVDDSGSMAFEQGGERIDDLKLILNRVAYACSLFDQDGISVRFMNSNVDGDHITNERAAADLLQRVRFSGLTPLGTSMDRKILQPLVLGPARAGQLAKPVLIITITDGAPAGEDRYTITKVITNANRELAKTRYGPDAISFQIAQVGEDQKAQAFLAELDNHPEIGGLVDVTSSYEMESAEMLAKSGQELTPELWLVKLLLGGIDDSYDEKDEK